MPWYSSQRLSGDILQGGVAASERFVFDYSVPGDILQVGAFLTSTNGMFMLIMQEDCNVVVYHVRKDPTTNATVSQEAIWSTGSNGGGNSCIFRLLGRGQVVVLRSMYDSRVKWHSSDRYFSDPIPPFQLMLMDDGALIVAFETDFDPAPYTVLWASR